MSKSNGVVRERLTKTPVQDETSKPFIRFYPAAHAIWKPVPSAPKRSWFSQHAYYCTPLLVANQYGWTVMNPATWIARWNGGEDKDDVEVVNTTEKVAKAHFGSGIVTIDVGFYVETSDDIDLLIKAVPNYPMDGLCTMEGIVETDWHDGIFTLNFRLTRPNQWVMRKPNTPLAQLVPVQRGWLETVSLEWEEGTERHDERIKAALLSTAQYPNGREDKDGLYRRGKKRDGSTAKKLPTLKIALDKVPGTTRPEIF
jgi:hypothetical protein